MPSSTMWMAALQATALTTLSLILSRHMAHNMFEEVYKDEAFIDLMTLMNASQSLYNTSQKSTTNAGRSANGTFLLSNTTEGVNLKAETVSDSFYSRVLPRDIVRYFVLYTLQYCWFVGLERLLPSRPRPRMVLHEGKEKGEEDEDREEEVIKRWIAQGRVRRASLNWCNTFLKWVLVMTVGTIGFSTLDYVLDGLLNLKSPGSLFGLLGFIASIYMGSFLAMDPLFKLVAFIVVPAHRQVVFLAGAGLVINIFYDTAIRAFATWAVKTDFAQIMMRNVTGEVRNKGLPELEMNDREL